MSSKFFTWTKGDRSRHVSESLFTGAVVPIPVECIHIKGFDYSRTPKSNRRRPVPLTLEQNQEELSSYDPRLDDSTALQDAAVKSATSLIAVVNDMLRSPLASARLPPQPSSLTPHHGRPRSRTAPSTPLVEAPSRPPVELPGSFPERPRASYHHSFDGKLKTRLSQGPRHDQPCKNARRPSHPWLHLPPTSKDETSTAKSQDVTGHHDSRHLPQQPQWERSSKGIARARASLPSGSAFSQLRQSHYPGVPVPWHDPMSRESNPQIPLTSLDPMPKDGQPLVETQVELSVDDEVPLSDIASLHASHEVHMATIVEAHRREITSLRMYIAFLEQRRGLSRTSELHVDRSVRSPPKYQVSTRNAEGQHMNFRSTAEGSSVSRQSTPHECLNPPFNTHCTSYAGYGEIWLECNHLRDSLDTCRRHIAHAEETISRMQRLELSLKNENGELRSRLLAANNERMDVQEGLHEACRAMRKLAEREASLVHENEILRLRSLHAAKSVSPEDAIKVASHKKSGHCRTRSDVSYQRTNSKPRTAKNGTQSPMLSADVQRRRVGVDLPDIRQQIPADDSGRHFTAHEIHMQRLSKSSVRAVSHTNTTTTTPLTTSTKNDTTRMPYTSESHLPCQEEPGIQTNNIQPSEHDLQGTKFDKPDPPQSQQSMRPTTPRPKHTPIDHLPTTERTPSPTPSLSSSKSSSTSLGASLPQTPRTFNTTPTEAPPMPTTEPSLNKRLPKPPPLDSEPVVKRGETMKSVGGSIIELYAGRGRGDDGGEWEENGKMESFRGGDGGWVEWV